MNKIKPTILIDLDGVLNNYDGKYDKHYIPPIAHGAFNFIKNISEKYEIKIFTSRNKLLASKWIIDNNLFDYISDITSEKEPAKLYIDDRCITFTGDFDKLYNDLTDFKVWYKK